MPLRTRNIFRVSKERKSLVLKMLRSFCAACGWLLFAIEWIRIWHQTTHFDEMLLLSVLISLFILIHICTYFWIRHNKHIAARGKRGAVTRYMSPIFVKDCLGRTLVIDEEVTDAQEITVCADDTGKFYQAVEVEVAIQ